jgi:hypothetical protein
VTIKPRKLNVGFIIRVFRKKKFYNLYFFSCTKKRSIKTFNDKSKPVPLVGVTTIIFMNSNLEDFNNDTKIEFEFLNKYFKANRLSLNFDKIHFLQIHLRIVLKLIWKLVILTYQFLKHMIHVCTRMYACMHACVRVHI